MTLDVKSAPTSRNGGAKVVHQIGQFRGEIGELRSVDQPDSWTRMPGVVEGSERWSCFCVGETQEMCESGINNSDRD